MSALLLPPNSETWERCVADAASLPTSVRDAVDEIRYDKVVSPPSAFLPFLIWEYGLGELTPYVPNLYDLLNEGIQWQRVRGTFAAIQRGLAWIDYTATVEEAWHGRAWWNSYQLRFDRLPEFDDPDLERIEGISILSTPKRSQLRRGVYQYDIGPAIPDWSRLDHCMLERESGVTATPAGTLWSFGRTTEIEHVLTEAEGLALGNWIAPPEGETLKWVDMQYPWVTATFPWAASATTQRRALMAAWFAGRTLYAALRDIDGEIIGYRLCRIVRPVNQAFGGRYSFAGVTFAQMAGGTRVYIEAMTDFEDADKVTAAQISLVSGADLAPGIPPGRAWLRPQDVSGGLEFATRLVSIDLRATVRDQFKFMMRF
jgi:hypothetical protein